MKLFLRTSSAYRTYTSTHRGNHLGMRYVNAKSARLVERNAASLLRKIENTATQYIYIYISGCVLLDNWCFNMDVRVKREAYTSSDFKQYSLSVLRTLL